MLKKGWFVQDSIEKTLENLIAESDLELFTSITRQEFEQRLIDEVRMTSLCRLADRGGAGRRAIYPRTWGRAP